jgi:DNA modification methylase
MSAIRREVIIGDCRLLLGDCLDILPTLGKVDAVVTDPPYGIGETSKKAATRVGRPTAIWRDPRVKDYGHNDWDVLNPEAVQLARSISRHQIIFGGNYYELPPTSCWLVWYKDNPTSHQSDAELAWTNLPKAVRHFTWLWDGFKRKAPEERFHLTQKPLALMKWCIGHLPDSARTILDPFMGSGTTGVACASLNRCFIGIEREEHYFDIACERIRKAYAQPDFFVTPPKREEPKQEAML